MILYPFTDHAKAAKGSSSDQFVNNWVTPAEDQKIVRHVKFHGIISMSY